MEAFDPEKLLQSLRHAGADPEVAQTIEQEIEKELKDGMTTHELYRHAFTLLREHRRETAARYSLKRAVLEFGPSGFPFEGYLAELFRAEGYDVSIDQHVRGKCVEHEVDVILKKETEEILVEAKFHNTIGFKTDLQVVMYVDARIRDIQETGEHSPHLRGLVATNTKFTSLAVQYGNCAGLKLLGWEYPAGRNLNHMIESTGLYPITTLTTLSRREKITLLSEKVLLCKALSRKEDALARAGVPRRRMQAVLAEASGLCGVTP